ncbi:MAG: hypothetical protein ACLFWM_07620 [Actinomycetota bacterium]
MSAEAAVDDLRRSGLADEHLGLAVHSSDTYVFEEDAGSNIAHGIERGLAVGAPIGALAGMAVLSLVAPAVGATLGVAGILAAGGATGALAGGFWGAYLGLTSEEHVLEEEWDWERTPLQPGQVLVVVCQHGDPEDVARILGSRGGRLIARPAHLG